MRRGVLIMLLGLAVTMTGCGEKQVNNVGLKDGRLAQCPSSPNCVSSMDVGKQAIAPIPFLTDRKTALSRMKSVLRNMSGVDVEKETEEYLWATATSRVFGFVDDLEFYFPENEKRIHVRSASRTGYYDFGMNRKRLETIRKAFEIKQ